MKVQPSNWPSQRSNCLASHIKPPTVRSARERLAASLKTRRLIKQSQLALPGNRWAQPTLPGGRGPLMRNKAKPGMDGIFEEESALCVGRFDSEAIVRNKANRWTAAAALTSGLKGRYERTHALGPHQKQSQFPPMGWRWARPTLPNSPAVVMRNKANLPRRVWRQLWKHAKQSQTWEVWDI